MSNTFNSLLNLSSFLIAFFHTQSSSSSRNSDFRSSLQIGHDNDFALSPGGTTTYCACDSASRFATSSAATALALYHHHGPFLYYLSMNHATNPSDRSAQVQTLKNNDSL